ncbi:hypothetical protein GOBAR_DD01053 [Gossypium barbadense]|nr:hypothetical protein GOBAR_DD01053 [Gossypium barbadense]
MNEPLPIGDFVMGASDVVSNSDVGWATKKVRRWPDMPPDVEDPTVDGNVRKVQSPQTPKASYKSTLMGSATLPMQIDNFEENFELLDGYVMTEVVDGIPSITFSVRVQKFIERKMARTIVVKLLGRKIGFNALLNKVSSLWSLRCSFQLIDLENDFFLESESGKSIPVVEEVSLQHQAGGNPHVQMGSRISKPNNSNVGSFNYVGPTVSVDNLTMSQNYVSSRNGNTSFKPVIVHSNLDKEKHKVVQATEKENASEGDFERDKPPDGRLVVHNPDTVELSEAIEGIVKQLERDTEGDVMTDDRFGGPKVMVVNTTGNGTLLTENWQVDGEVVKNLDNF